MTAFPDQALYAAAWRRYRRWSWTFWIVFATFLPGIALINRDLVRMGAGSNAVLVAVFAWMVAFVIAGYQKGNFICPRCGQLFFRKFDDRPGHMTWKHNPFARRCMHCALPKWAVEDTPAV